MNKEKGKEKEKHLGMSSERILKIGETGTGLETEGKATERGTLKQRFSVMAAHQITTGHCHGCSPDHNQSLAEPALKPVAPVTRNKGRLYESIEASTICKDRQDQL